MQRDVGVARIAAPEHDAVRRYGFEGARPFLDETGHPMLAAPDSLYRYDPQKDRFVALMPRAQPGTQVGSASTDRSGVFWISAASEDIEACDPAPRRP